MTFDDIVAYAGGSLVKDGDQYIWSPVEPEIKISYGVSIVITIKRKRDQYTAIPSHRVISPKTGGQKYVPLAPQNTPEKALYDCISGFKSHMSTPSETQWAPL